MLVRNQDPLFQKGESHPDTGVPLPEFSTEVLRKMGVTMQPQKSAHPVTSSCCHQSLLTVNDALRECIRCLKTFDSTGKEVVVRR